MESTRERERERVSVSRKAPILISIIASGCEVFASGFGTPQRVQKAKPLLIPPLKLPHPLHFLRIDPKPSPIGSLPLVTSFLSFFHTISAAFQIAFYSAILLVSPEALFLWRHVAHRYVGSIIWGFPNLLLLLTRFGSCPSQ